MTAFKQAIGSVEGLPLSRPEHPDVPGARFVLFQDFPYLVFYTVYERDIVVVSIEYASSDYVSRVTMRMGLAR